MKDANIMKPPRHYSVLIVFLCSLLLLTCSDSHSDAEMGTFTFNFGNDISRAVYPPIDGDGNPVSGAPDLRELRYFIRFSSPDGPRFDFTFDGLGPHRGRVPVGTYTVSVRIAVMPGGTPYAYGEAVNNPVIISGGSNAPIRVQLADEAGRPVIGILLINPPTATSFQGFAPDLNGMIIRVVYADGSWEDIDDDFFFPYFLDRPVIEQDILPETFRVGINTGSGILWIYIDVNNVVGILPGSIGYTGTLLKQDYFEDDFYPDFTGITMHAQYDDGQVRTIPFYPIREINWFASNDYYLYPDGSPRRLIDPGPPRQISYRIASGDVPPPDPQQSIGVDPRGAYPGTELFIEIPFTNWFPVSGISCVGAITKIYTIGTLASEVNWIRDFFDSGMILSASYSGTPTTRIVDEGLFLVCERTRMATMNASDTVLGPTTTLDITYFGQTFSISLVVQ